MSRQFLKVEPDQAWSDHARCKGRTELFFGRPNERPEARARREALAGRYCAVCPVLERCRAWARGRGENGFWGGESEEDRAAAGHPPLSITRRSVAAAGRSVAAGATSRHDVGEERPPLLDARAS